MADTGYDPHTETFRATVDWDQTDPLFSAVIETVAVATDTDPEHLPQFHNALDVESLTDLFAADRTQVIAGFVCFRYADCQVTISHDGGIAVTTLNSGARFLPAE